MRLSCLLSILFILKSFLFYAQSGASVHGIISDREETLPGSTVQVAGKMLGASADENGFYMLKGLPAGKHTLVFRSVGYVSETRDVEVVAGQNLNVDVTLKRDNLKLGEIVVSATRDRVAREKAPVVVNTINSRLFNAVNSVTLSETLNYTPGVRLETNCQNCNTTQVRLNGLEGRYSQILVDSRPVFSALNGVYGLEQIPTSILERVEVVRSGGSALFGSNAIAGTINIITKEPVLNSWEVNSNLGLLGGEALDRTLGFNTSVVADDLKSGITTFGNMRNRDSYDADGDGFSEKTELQDNFLGFNAFIKPDDLGKLHINMTASKSFRRGGDQLETPPQFVDIAEQLDHNTVLGGLTYDRESPGGNNTWSVFLSAQHTDRKSYYGGLMGGRTRQDAIHAANAFGNTTNISATAGGKFIHRFDENNNLTIGFDYRLDNVDDQMPGYSKVNHQNLQSYGLYGQYSWKPLDNFTTLVGARLDHVDVDGVYRLGELGRKANADVTVLSPRITIMYTINPYLKFRGGYARGFQAPQAYDENFEVSSAGGLQQFTILADGLQTEFSNSYTASLNFTRFFNQLQTSFLVEGFYTELIHPFTTVTTSQIMGDYFLINEIRNGSGSYVSGLNFDLGLSPSRRFTANIGGTWQNAVYREPQVLFEADPENTSRDDVVVNAYPRTPAFYGYVALNTEPLRDFDFDISGTFTGPMKVPHIIDDSGYIVLKDSPSFFDLNLKLSRHVELTDHFHITLSGGVQNVFNNYQKDFDQGPTRDADYIYGPASPRTFFIGLTLGNL